MACPGKRDRVEARLPCVRRYSLPRPSLSVWWPMWVYGHRVSFAGPSLGFHGPSEAGFCRRVRRGRPRCIFSVLRAGVQPDLRTGPILCGKFLCVRRSWPARQHLYTVISSDHFPSNNYSTEPLRCTSSGRAYIQSYMPRSGPI